MRDRSARRPRRAHPASLRPHSPRQGRPGGVRHARRVAEAAHLRSSAGDASIAGPSTRRSAACSTHVASRGKRLRGRSSGAACRVRHARGQPAGDRLPQRHAGDRPRRACRRMNRAIGVAAWIQPDRRTLPGAGAGRAEPRGRGGAVRAVHEELARLSDEQRTYLQPPLLGRGRDDGSREDGVRAHPAAPLGRDARPPRAAAAGPWDLRRPGRFRRGRGRARCTRSRPDERARSKSDPVPRASRRRSRTHAGGARVASRPGFVTMPTELRAFRGPDPTGMTLADMPKAVEAADEAARGGAGTGRALRERAREPPRAPSPRTTTAPSTSSWSSRTPRARVVEQPSPAERDRHSRCSNDARCRTVDPGGQRPEVAVGWRRSWWSLFARR